MPSGASNSPTPQLPNSPTRNPQPKPRTPNPQPNSQLPTPNSQPATRNPNPATQTPQPRTPNLPPREFTSTRYARAMGSCIMQGAKADEGAGATQLQDKRRLREKALHSRMRREPRCPNDPISDFGYLSVRSRLCLRHHPYPCPPFRVSLRLLASFPSVHIKGLLDPSLVTGHASSSSSSSPHRTDERRLAFRRFRRPPALLSAVRRRRGRDVLSLETSYSRRFKLRFSIGIDGDWHRALPRSAESRTGRFEL